jgi:LacI family transcriptional regulator
LTENYALEEKKHPTIKDIAEISGFSIGTVDRALHNRGEINAQTKRKILEVAKTLGYETNYVASALSRKNPWYLLPFSPGNSITFTTTSVGGSWRR